MTVHYKPAIVRPGDEITVDADLQSRTETPVDGITIRLIGKETLDFGSDRLTEKHVDLVAYFPATVLSPGVHTRSALFRIPEGVPPTYRELATTMQYEISVHVDIPWWPDLRQAFVVAVDPSDLPASPVPSDVAAGVLIGPRGSEVHFDASLDQCAMFPGEVLSGQVTFRDLIDRQTVSLAVVFVATESEGGNAPREAGRYEATVWSGVPVNGVAIDFRVELPHGASVTFTGKHFRRAWRVVVGVQAQWRASSSVGFDLDVRPRPPGSLEARGLKGSISHVGAERRIRAWADVAAKLDLVHDRDAGRLSFAAGDVKLEISTEEGPAGMFIVAQLAWPSLGVDLAIARRQLADVLRDRIETEDAPFDRAFRVEARERAQALAFLIGDLRLALGTFEDETLSVDDAGARLSAGGNARDEQTLAVFAKRAKALARAIEKAHRRVPLPAVLARHEPAWRAAAARLGGRLEPGRPWIHGGLWGDATVELGIVWQPGATVSGTVLRVKLDPPLAAEVDPAAPPAKTSKPALARMKALAEKVHAARFGPDAVEVTVAAACLDPEETLPLFDEIAAVAAALQGRLEGPYR